jgi:hypothetical protein
LEPDATAQGRCNASLRHRGATAAGCGKGVERRSTQIDPNRPTSVQNDVLERLQRMAKTTYVRCQALANGAQRLLTIPRGPIRSSMERSVYVPERHPTLCPVLPMGHFPSWSYGTQATAHMGSYLDLPDWPQAALAVSEDRAATMISTRGFALSLPRARM